MSTFTIGLAWIVAQAAVGCHGGGKGPVGSSACLECSGTSPGVAARIVVLQKAPRWRDRDRAAQELRHVDWRRHPEVVGALAFSLLRDPSDEVREEAAESLARMRACLPEARESLRIAAARDPDHMTRKWARRGLAALPSRCGPDCLACGTVVVTAPAALPIEGAPTILEPASPPPPPRPLAEPAFEAIPDAPIESTVPALPSDVAPLPAPAEDVSARPLPAAPGRPTLAAPRFPAPGVVLRPLPRR